MSSIPAQGSGCSRPGWRGVPGPPPQHRLLRAVLWGFSLRGDPRGGWERRGVPDGRSRRERGARRGCPCPPETRTALGGATPASTRAAGPEEGAAGWQEGFTGDSGSQDVACRAWEKERKGRRGGSGGRAAPIRRAYLRSTSPGTLFIAPTPPKSTLRKSYPR